MTTESTWTHERFDEMRRLICIEHLSRAETGKRLGVTKNAVEGKCYREGVGLRPCKRAEPTPNPFPADGGCLWPYGHPDDPRFHFCGGHRMPDRPYCAKHAAVAYVRPTDKVPA